MVKRRKEDRQTRKKTKYGLESDQLKSGGNVVSKHSSNASIVFSKNSYASLVLRGKARQQQLKQQAAKNVGDSSMEVDSSPIPLATGIKSMAGKLARQGSHKDDLVEDLPVADANTQELDPTLSGKRDSSLKAYMKELRKVMDNADVLLEVLDARDPLGCRSLETETMLMRAGKKVVLILNKIDLVPKANVEAWLKHLRHDFPTLAFKASTQSQRNNLSQGASSVHSKSGKSNLATNDASSIQGGSEAIGAGALLQLIKNYSRNLNMKTSIAVGVFGAPNVGKSSVINSLKRARVCSVASTPGHTKVVQSVMLDKNVRLLDCPGIVFSDESAAGAQALGLTPAEIVQRRQSALLRNVVKVELVQDPITPVEAIMARVESEHLCQVYGLDFFQPNDAQDLLMRIAISRGRLARGGKIDIEGTARSVLHDWNIGRINYYTQPPALHRSAILSSSSRNDQHPSEASAATPLQTNLEQSTAIVPQFSEAFDLAALLGEADAEVFGINGISGGSGLTADLPEAPAPRFVEAETVSDVESIVNDHIPVESQGDTSRQSTLGKRIRAAESDSDDDMSYQDEDSMLDDEEEDEALQQTIGIIPLPQANFTFQSSGTALGPGKRASELGLAFSTSELSHMAVPTSTQRQRLKKLKKRAQRSTAGLAGIFEQDAALGDDSESAAMRSPSKRGTLGMFGSLSQPTSNTTPNGSATTRPRSKAPSKTGSMFDVLMMAQDEEGDDQDESAAHADHAIVVHREEFEEEL